MAASPSAENDSMGIYDRTYYRDDESGSLLNGRSMVFG